jgi:hypothetical protein
MRPVSVVAGGEGVATVAEWKFMSMILCQECVIPDGGRSPLRSNRQTLSRPAYDRSHRERCVS